jgi:hypothetical protein
MADIFGVQLDIPAEHQAEFNRVLRHRTLPDALEGAPRPFGGLPSAKAESAEVGGGNHAIGLQAARS